MAAKYPEQIKVMEQIFEETGISVDELARQSGFSKSTLERVRRGNSKASEYLLRHCQTAAQLYRERMAKVNPMRILAQREGREMLKERGGDVSLLREEPVPYGPRRTVPVVGFVAGANILSDRAFDYTDMANQIEEGLETDSKDPNALGLIVEGDSMDPEYQEGDRIVVAPNAEPRNKDVVVARLREEGSAMLKRFYRIGPEGKRIRLESTNQLYKPREYPLEAFRFIYPVVEMKRKPRR